MATYIISYDLQKPGQNYADLYARIKYSGIWAHIAESTWAVVTDQSATQVRDYLWAAMDANDRLFVVRSGGESAWVGLPVEVSNWLKQYP